jgi:hypothetical protein
LENPQQQIEIRIRLQKVAEICKEERGMARVNCLQRFAKRRGKWQLAREKLLQRFAKRTGVCLAREKKIQRFPKRTERELRSILQCKEDREKERATSILHKLTNHCKKAREGATSILQKLTNLCKEDRGGCIDSAKTYAVESWWQGIMGQVSTFRSFSGCIE